MSFSCGISKKSTNAFDDKNISVISLIPDSRLFDTTDLDNPSPVLYYQDQIGYMQKVIMKKDSVSVIHAGFPILLENNGAFLVYPGEEVRVGLDSSYNYSFTTSDGKRNVEFLFLTQYNKLILGRRSEVLNIDGGMTFAEKFIELKKNGKKWDQKRLEIFDSLVKHSNVSSNFSSLVRNFSKARSHGDELANLYFFNKHSIDSDSLRPEIFDYLLSCVNSIESAEEIQFGGNTLILEVANNILPEKIKNIRSVDVLQNMFDSIVSKFKNPARDFLLMKIIESAYNNNVNVPEDYLVKFKKLCAYQIYIKGVEQIRKASMDRSLVLKKMGSNALIELSAQARLRQTRLEEVLQSNRGKLVLLDFWATWCLPCIQEHPMLQELKGFFPSEKMVVLSISFDKQVSAWQEILQKRGWNTENQFVFVNSGASDFVRKYNIQEIPRYVLIDKNGNVIMANAPRPSNPALKQLIEKHL